MKRKTGDTVTAGGSTKAERPPGWRRLQEETREHRRPNLPASPAPSTPSTTTPGAIRVVRPEVKDTVIVLDVSRAHLTIGRSSSVDVRVESDRVSRLHGLIRFQDGAWLYEDLGSANGSLIVDGDDTDALFDMESTQELPVKVLTPKERHRLTPGEVIILGSRSARIEILAATAPEAVVDDHNDRTRRSPAAKKFHQELLAAASTNLPVFLMGHSGTGKTHAARDLHQRSLARGQFVPVNCARLPRDDVHLHSTLLGHTKGGFTGALNDRQGLLAHASGGTLFLDEVESLPDIAQGFLLDVLEGTGMALPLGSPPGARPPDMHFRLISSSKAALHHTQLRPDLAHRLTEGHVIVVPSLRDRRLDIPGITEVLLAEISREQSAQFRFGPGTEAFLVDQDWEGEIRALRAVVRTAATNALVSQSSIGVGAPRVVVTKAHFEEVFEARSRAFHDEKHRPPTGATVLPTAAASPGNNSPSTPVHASTKRLRDLDENDVRQALRNADNNITHAADNLGIARNTLVSRMKKFHINA